MDFALIFYSLFTGLWTAVPQKTLYLPCKIKGFVKSWCEDQPQQIHRFFTQLSHHFACFFYKIASPFRHWFDDVVLDVLFMDLDRQTAPLWPPMWPSWSSVRPCPSQIGQKSCPKSVSWRIKNQYFSSEGLLGSPGLVLAHLWHAYGRMLPPLMHIFFHIWNFWLSWLRILMKNWTLTSTQSHLEETSISSAIFSRHGAEYLPLATKINRYIYIYL